VKGQRDNGSIQAAASALSAQNSTSSEKGRLIAESAGLEAGRGDEGVAVLDPGGRVLYCSAAFARVYGYSAQDLIGSPLQRLFREQSEAEVKSWLSSASKEKLSTFEAVHRSSAGSALDLSASLLALSIEPNAPDYYVLIVRGKEKSPLASKVTENATEEDYQWKAQQAEERNRLYIRALEEAHGAILITTPTGEIIYANRSALGLYGYTRRHLIGKNLRNLVPGTDRQTILDILELMKEEDHWVGDMTLQRSSGLTFFVRLAITTVRDAEGEPQAFIVSSYDLSEQRLLEANLRQAQKLEAVGLLASGLAHNINSPLAAIMVTAEMAQAKYPDIREFGDIMQAADRIMEIIANLMTKSRQEQATEETEIDLNQLIKTELKFLEANLFFKHQVTLDVTLDPVLPRVHGLYSDFSQCFYNLVQNALDAMQSVEERVLTVRTGFTEDKKAIYIAVRDTGCGIPKELLEKIFEPFFTTKPEASENPEQVRPSGTGLGLSTTQQLLSNYNGTMTVTSQLSKGSEFTILVPLSPQAPLCREDDLLTPQA
jgi:PAS domain S-box-containing protein